MRCFYMGRSTRSGLPKVAGRLERSLEGDVSPHLSIQTRNEGSRKGKESLRMQSLGFGIWGSRFRG